MSEVTPFGVEMGTPIRIDLHRRIEWMINRFGGYRSSASRANIETWLTCRIGSVSYPAFIFAVSYAFSASWQNN